MPTSLFSEQRASMLQLLAAGIGCEPEDLEHDALTIVDRPENNFWYSVFGVTFGVGAVLSVDPRLRTFVEEHAPSNPVRALRPVLMQRVVDECSSEDAHLAYQIPGICWALEEGPTELEAPAGLHLDRRDTDWIAEEVKTGRWDNGLGKLGDGREFRNQFAVAALDAKDEPVAVAGVFETYGMFEIGVDVLPTHQGQGLGPLVVCAAAKEILKRGRTPLYGCFADNIRSQRTALASGFRPVFTDATVFKSRS